jgi:hypothetical protein
MLTNCYICGRKIYNSTDPEKDIYHAKISEIPEYEVPEEKREEYNKMKQRFPDYTVRICKECNDNLMVYTFV